MKRGLIFSGLVAAALAGGCSTPTRDSGQSTAITVEDVEDITTEIAAKLKASDFLVSRAPDSPPITITINKVVNYTSDVLRESDRWYLMYRVIDSISLRELGKQRNISLVIPAEQFRDLKSRVPDARDYAQRKSPTHVMEAVFRSVTRAAGGTRADAYYCQYTITEVATGRTVWTEGFQFKRAAVGRAYN